MLRTKHINIIKGQCKIHTRYIREKSDSCNEVRLLIRLGEKENEAKKYKLLRYTIFVKKYIVRDLSTTNGKKFKFYLFAWLEQEVHLLTNYFN